MTKHSRNGFTLLEAVIYAGLFAVILSAVLGMFYSLMESERRNRERLAVESEANFVMQKIAWALTGIESVNSPASGATSTALSVDKFGFDDDPIVFELGSGRITMSKGSGEAADLFSSRVRALDLVFENMPAAAGRPPGVAVSISAGDVSGRASTTLSGKFYLRQ